MADSIRVILAGATGWAGSALARGIARAPDLKLVGAVARSAAGRALDAVLGEPALAAPVHATATEALGTACDVFVEFTKPESAKTNIRAALAAGVHVVVGTSGLSDEDYAEIDSIARQRGRGATLNGVQVHSVRLPGYVIGVEAVFGAAGQRLHIAHHAGPSAEPYVDGALLAIRKVGTLTGLHRGLDAVMEN